MRGGSALQYSTTDGYLPLREYIATRYQQRLGLPATADEIQIVERLSAVPGPGGKDPG